jgi:hypothetical protein
MALRKKLYSIKRKKYRKSVQFDNYFNESNFSTCSEFIKSTIEHFCSTWLFYFAQHVLCARSPCLSRSWKRCEKLDLLSTLHIYNKKWTHTGTPAANHRSAATNKSYWSRVCEKAANPARAPGLKSTSHTPEKVCAMRAGLSLQHALCTLIRNEIGQWNV